MAGIVIEVCLVMELELVSLVVCPDPPTEVIMCRGFLFFKC